jgi:thymidylate synthase (FAD)
MNLNIGLMLGLRKRNGDEMKIVEQGITPIWHTQDPLAQIERIARVCYKSAPKGNSESFVRSLIENHHDAMIEHAVASFLLVTDRGIGNEVERHRMASFAQESTRWCNYLKEKFGSELTFVNQPFRNISSFEIWIEFLEFAEKTYARLIENGELPEMARSVLPLCLKTEIVVTCNFREWRHIMSLRLGKTAHPMVRQLAGYVHQWFCENYPVIVEGIDC